MPLSIQITYVTLETKLVFKETIQCLAVLASIRTIDPIVRAHERGDTALDSVLERPEIDLMHCAVIDVGRNGFDSLALIVGRRVALRFLLVSDIIL
jgi:hypothetical protein